MIPCHDAFWYTTLIDFVSVMSCTAGSRICVALLVCINVLLHGWLVSIIVWGFIDNDNNTAVHVGYILDVFALWTMEVLHSCMHILGGKHELQKAVGDFMCASLHW